MEVDHKSFCSVAQRRIGKAVNFEVLDDVLVINVLVIACGDSARATVTEAKTKGRMGKPESWMSISTMSGL